MLQTQTAGSLGAKYHSEKTPGGGGGGGGDIDKRRGGGESSSDMGKKKGKACSQLLSVPESGRYRTISKATKKKDTTSKPWEACDVRR